MDKLVLILPISAIILLLFWFSRCISALRLPDPGRGAHSVEAGVSACWPVRRRGLERRDALAMLLITGIYAITAFFNLGSHIAPESFCNFSERGCYADIQLAEPQVVSGLLYYSGNYHGDSYFVQVSQDGETFTDVGNFTQGHADVFKWHTFTLEGDGTPVRWLRIISGTKLEMGELALLDATGAVIPAETFSYDPGCAPLFDEQDTLPAGNRATYLNGSYFDEIYHARTAYEHIENVKPYEITHPPLGKIFISLGIRAFGMNPFGWRFIGVLFGILMVPLFYLFAKNLFGSTAIAVCGTAMFAFDFMHYVQTRIATIDTYAVLFILLSYLFMFRWVSADWDDPLASPGRRYLSLALSGIFWGIGCASKWTVIYGGLGLALIWILHWVFRGRGLCRAGHGRRLRRELRGSILWCLVFFIAVPLVIYYLSYTPYGTAQGLSAPGMYFSREYLDIVLDNQTYMLTYHVGVDSTHPYSSSWYQWLVDGRPILYWLDRFGDGTKSSFGAFLNPLVCWGGLLAMVVMAVRSFTRSDKRALFILIGYLSQLLPWVLVPRLTFAYHYFPCLIFLVLALCHRLDLVRRSRRRWQPLVYGFSAVTTALFPIFYPVLSGARVTDWYSNLLGWFPSWPF